MSSPFPLDVYGQEAIRSVLFVYLLYILPFKMTIEVNSSPSLPPEIWEHICDYFDAETVNNFAQVCREWRSIAQVGRWAFYAVVI